MHLWLGGVNEQDLQSGQVMHVVKWHESETRLKKKKGVVVNNGSISLARMPHVV